MSAIPVLTFRNIRTYILTVSSIQYIKMGKREMGGGKMGQNHGRPV